jgi:hypothetical protein
VPALDSDPDHQTRRRPRRRTARGRRRSGLALVVEVQAWFERTHETFTTTQPTLDANDVPLSRSDALLQPQNGTVTLGALIASFNRSLGRCDFAHAALAVFALEARRDGNPRREGRQDPAAPDKARSLQ